MAPDPSRRLAAFLVFIVASFLLAGPHGYRLLRFAYGSGEQDFILLVPAISAALIYLHRQKIFAVVDSGFTPAAAICGTIGLLGILIAYFSAGDLQLVATAVGLVALWIGGFVFFFGKKAGRAALFPLLMLVWMVPIPTRALDFIEVALQRGSAELVDVLFQAVGVPVFRNGMVFVLRDVAIEVAKECSGIRSTLSLLLLMMVVVHEALQSNWRRAIVLSLTVPVVVLKNAVRIVTLTLLAMYVDPSFLTGDLHHRGGIVFFLVGLALLLPVVGVLRRGELQKQPATAMTATQSASTGRA